MKKVLALVFALACFVGMKAYDVVYVVGDSSPAGWSLDDANLAKATMTEVSDNVFEWTGLLTKTTGEGFKLLTQKDWNPGMHPSTAGLVLNEVGSDVVALPYSGDPDTKWTISETAEYTLRVTFRETDVLVELEKAGEVASAVPQVDGVYQISNAADFETFAKDLNSGLIDNDCSVVLTQDIDLSSIAVWTAIGTDGKKFIGTFDGQGFRVKGMNVNGALKEQGLFGVAGAGAVIKNLIMDASCNIVSTEGQCMAAFVGCCNNDGTIVFENCGNEANVTGTKQNNAAFLGCNYGGTNIVFNNCYNTGKVSGGWENGAFSGWCGGGATFNNCYNIGEVSEGETWARGNKSMNNCYQTVGNDGGVTQITAEQVASGELCYLLGGTFGQTLGQDAYPNFTGKKVILSGKSYANVDVESSNGSSDCILPSFKWGGSYSAYTFVAQADYGFGDWNESNPNYNVIVGTPEEQDGYAWYAPGYNTSAWNYGKDLPNFGNGDPADVYAVRYFTVKGEIPSTLYMPVPHDDAPCEYYINGQLIWSETDGWNEWEVVRLTDEQKALIKTDGSVNVFAFHVHQNWGGRYADGGLYTAGNMVNDFNNEYRCIEATIALAEAEGIDAAVIEYAKSKSNYRNGISSGLAQLRKARRIAFDGRTENFVGTEPQDGLVAYILNVGAKMFLAGGNDWGTHASLNHMGAKCVLHTNTYGANCYSIQTNLPNGLRGRNDGLGHNGYVDCGDWNTTSIDWAWQFEAVGDGSYRIINCQNSGDNIYLGMTDDERLQVDTDKAGADNPYNKWILVTPEEFYALAEDATEENPVDLGHLVHQATFSQNDFDGNDKWAEKCNAELDDSAWERNAGNIWNWKGNDAGGDYTFEMWNTKNVGRVYLIQEVEGLPAGNYTVQMNGYYRDGNFESTDEGNVRQLAYLFAGSEDNCTPLVNIVEDSGNMPGYGRGGASGIVIPDGCRDAARFFQVGSYVNTIDAVVGTDGKLKIGVYRDTQEEVKEGDWIVVDNFRLYYKGNPVEVTVTSAGYATFVAPANIKAIPEGVEAFAAQANPADKYVHLEPVAAIPAGEAVVLKAAEGTYTFNATARAAELGTDNDLQSSTEEVTADGTQYILAEVDGVAGFAKAAPDSKIPAGKGFLSIEGSSVKAFYPFGEDATGISQIANGQATENAVIYNLAGQRISKVQKGISIVGGKKILK